MKIAYHVGLHATDDDLLLKSLMKNRGRLDPHNVMVPGPGKYRSVIREAVAAYLNSDVPEGKQAELLEAIGVREATERVVLSNTNFGAVPSRIFVKGEPYRFLPARVNTLTRLFPDHEVEIFMGLRNPASFIPAVFSRIEGIPYPRFMGECHPEDMSYADLMYDVLEASPNVTITAWCNEDTPMIWARILRAMAGIPGSVPIVGGYDLLTQIMAPEGMKRFVTYMTENPPRSEAQKQKIIAAFLDKFALDDELEEDVDLPGWDEDLIENLTELYDEDVENILTLDRVTFLDP